MKKTSKSYRIRRFVPAVLAGIILAGLLGTAMASAIDAPPECAVSSETLSGAKAVYGDSCSLPRIDCDKIDGLWYCSSRVIGDAAPDGVTADEVGSSGLGNDGTVVVTLPPPPTEPEPTTTESPGTSPPDTEPPTTQPPTSEPPTTQAPTTRPPVTQPPTTRPPTTRPPVTQPPATAPPTTVDEGGNDPGLVRHTYTKTEGPERNPMKGWNSGWSDDRPEATVGFQYIKWQDLEPENGVFDFAAVEDVINRSGSRDRHVILRLYCDWWGENEESRGCPSWIYSEVGVDRIKGDNGRYITDYNDPRYLDEAVQAIEALGARYDDDPRLYAFELGVIGYWGEWHTWGSRVDGDSYQITEATESTILNAYRNAFDRTHPMARYPDRSILAAADGIGFHNDYFKPNNGHSAEFDESVAAGRRWVDGPIGGEIPPGLSSDDFRALYATSQGQEMIETGRYSTMKPTSVDSRYTSQHMRLHKRFGYNFQIEDATFAETASRTGSMAVALNATNVGIAPFYYDWDVQFALLGSDGEPVVVSSATSDLRDQLPGDSFSLRTTLALNGVDAGDYRLAARLVQPGAEDNKAQRWKLDARNTYILFANNMPVLDGAWDGQNRLVGGWSVLGSVAAE